MELIGKNNELIALLSDKNSLLDAQVTNVSIYENNSIVLADVRVLMRSSSDFREVVLVFEDVKEFSFYYRSDTNFYNIERVKFLSLRDGSFYLSLDPYDEEEEVSLEDQDFISSRMLIGYQNERSDFIDEKVAA